MRKLLMILGFISFFVLTSCHNKTNIHRDNYGGVKKGIKYNQKETFSKRTTKNGSDNFKPTKIYDKKKRGMVAQKSKNDKHNRQNSSYDRPLKETKGSYEYNSKKRTVTKKKFLFFTKHRHEKETSTFTGGKTKRFFKYNVFNKKKRRTVNKRGLFGNRKDKTKQKKIKERDLFDPKMHLKIKE